ncbi:MAG: MFS transporter [Paludibacteraceae bacterium]|nr:MFS transporter [Paludibacteraceae bacterium]
MKNIKLRLIIMNFLEFAVWGSYLTCMGRYLGEHGLGTHIGWFYAVQGIVSIFMPTLIGIVADRWMSAKSAMTMCHLMAGIFMMAAGWYGLQAGDSVQFAPLFTLYTISVAFFMPTIALDNSVCLILFNKNNMDSVKEFPPIRVFGTVGFICTMWVVDLLGFQTTARQFLVSGGLSIALAMYCLTLPDCKVVKEDKERKNWIEMLGLDGFRLFRQKKMAVFFLFSIFLGVCLQITNGYANPFLGSFQFIEEYADTFGVQHSNMLISLSQICEALCILCIPFFLKRFGIKNVIIMSMLAWVIRFGFFGLGNPGNGVWLFVLSCIAYGFAFDFFNISGALYVSQETEPALQSSGQGLFMMMTNGFGATIGTLSAQAIINRMVFTPAMTGADPLTVWHGWQVCWYIFAAYALVIAILFAIFFEYKHNPSK